MMVPNDKRKETLSRINRQVMLEQERREKEKGVWRRSLTIVFATWVLRETDLDP